jgi:hypothetical protein
VGNYSREEEHEREEGKGEDRTPKRKIAYKEPRMKLYSFIRVENRGCIPMLSPLSSLHRFTG